MFKCIYYDFIDKKVKEDKYGICPDCQTGYEEHQNEIKELKTKEVMQ